jgi:hypothetical protein
MSRHELTMHYLIEASSLPVMLLGVLTSAGVRNHVAL